MLNYSSNILSESGILLINEVQSTEIFVKICLSLAKKVQRTEIFYSYILLDV